MQDTGIDVLQAGLPRQTYCWLCAAVADTAPAASTDVAPFECCASTAPAALAEAELPPVLAPAPPVPARLAEEIGFCAPADADEAGAAPALLAGGASANCLARPTCVSYSMPMQLQKSKKPRSALRRIIVRVRLTVSTISACAWAIYHAKSWAAALLRLIS